MRKLLLAATAAVAIASPAAARDGAWYAGIEGGVLIIDDIEFDYEDANGRLENAFIFDHSTGFDVDIIGGYDLGMLRAEAEIGYKRASLDRVFPGDPFPGVPENSLEADGHASAISSMVNLLLDFGDDTGWSGYLGGGVGLARLKYDADVSAFDVGFSDTDDVVAWQGIAGVRMAVSPTMEVGVKYRYFRPADFKFGVADGDVPFRAEGRWQSHSLLASLIFNFAPPPPPVVIAPPPPPPPPPPPATQTCPDGSVILATDVCPLPPPPPPPPPPAGERG